MHQYLARQSRAEGKRDLSCPETLLAGSNELKLKHLRAMLRLDKQLEAEFLYISH